MAGVEYGGGNIGVAVQTLVMPEVMAGVEAGVFVGIVQEPVR